MSTFHRMAFALLLLFVNASALFGQPMAKEDDLPKDESYQIISLY